jgi:parvulin-like peptidyl-prolyl isomerase
LKKDIALALAAVALIFGLTFGINSMRPTLPLTQSKPYAAGLTPQKQGAEKAVMRVNGVAVTEAEFSSAFQQLPEEMQRQFASSAGKQAFAEQYIREKLLEQEGEKQGIEEDPKVQAILAAQRTLLLGNAAMAKIVKIPTEQATRQYYNEHKAEFVTVELSHIVIACQGGQIPPRKGGAPPTEQQAVQKAVGIYKQLRDGADFAKLAAAVSDDPNTASNGGSLGPVSKGMLPAEIEAQVFRVPPGQVSGPIPSRLGIHLFKLGQPAVQPYEAVKNVVTNRVRQQNAMDRIEILRKAAKVDFDPKFFPDAKTWGKTPGAPPS